MIPHPQESLWKGPYEDGISQSLMIKFNECPFRFFLYAYCGFRDPGKPHENLVWGNIFHKGAEYYLKGLSFIECVAIMRDYIQNKYPSSPSTYIHTTSNMLKLYPLEKTLDVTGSVDTEVIFEEYVQIPGLTKAVLIKGKADVLSKNRMYMGDHKCKGRIYPVETMRELDTDLQMNLYGYMFEISNWFYDLIAIPEEAYRCPVYNGYANPAVYSQKIFYEHFDTTYGFPIAFHKDRWICQIPHYKPMEKIDFYFKRTIAPLIRRMVEWWEYVTSSDFDPNNPECYNSTFYQMPIRMFDSGKTEKFKCNFYEAIIENDFSNLIPVDTMFPELKDE